MSLCHFFSPFECVERVSRYIDERNREVFEPNGIIIGDPMDRGLRCVSLMYRDPLCTGILNPQGSFMYRDILNVQRSF